MEPKFGEECQEQACRATAVFIHHLHDTRHKFCHSCAVTKGHTPATTPKAWTCAMHGRPVESFCVSHQEGCCETCESSVHQDPCNVRNVKDLVREKKSILNEKLPRLDIIQATLVSCTKKIDVNLPKMNDSFQRIEKEATAVIEDEIRKSVEKEGKIVKQINKEFDEKFRKLSEERCEALEKCREDAQERLTPLEWERDDLLSDLRRFSRDVIMNIKSRQQLIQHSLTISHESQSKIQNLLQSNHGDWGVLEDTNKISSSIDSTYQTCEKVDEELDKIFTLSNALHLKSTLRNKHPVIRLCIERNAAWEMVDEIKIPAGSGDERIMGGAWDGSVLLQDVRHGTGYLLNLCKRRLTKVFDYDGMALMNGCTALDDDSLLCGKTRAGCSGDVLKGCVCIYDRTWCLTKDIPIPRNTGEELPSVSVDVDPNGMILAAESQTSHIHVIDPTTEKVVKTIFVGEAKCKRLLCLSSGDIVVATARGEFSVIDRSGKTRRILRDERWKLAVDFTIDPLTDSIFVVYWNESKRAYAIDEVRKDGEKVRMIASFSQASWSDPSSHICTYPIVVTSSGHIVACNKDNIFIFKKSLHLGVRP